MNLQQTNLMPLQTGQKVQYWQDKSTVFLSLYLFLRALLCFKMGPSSVWVLSEDVLMLLLHNMDLLDLCAYDKCLQRVKKEEYEGTFYI